MTTRETNFQRFDRQIGGHDRLLSASDGSLVIKPCNGIENDFYENSVLHPDFAEWIPKYYGCLQLRGVQPTASDEQNDIEAVADDIINAQSAREEISLQHANITGVDRAVCIENLLYRFKRPCMMDLKLGTQLWGEDADEAKRKKMVKRAKETTSGSLGIKITAYQVYQKSTDSYFNFTRDDGNQLTPDTILSALAKFFTAEISIDHRRLIIERLLNDLVSCSKVLKGQEVRLVGSSLFFVYEGDPDALTEALKKEDDEVDNTSLDNYVEEGEEEEDEEEEEEEEEDSDLEEDISKIADLKMIDFAHSFFREGIGKDEGALFGVNNTIDFFKQILSQ